MALKKTNLQTQDKMDMEMLMAQNRLRSRKKPNLKAQEQRDAYLLITPLLILTFAFIFFPMVSNFVYSFTDWRGFGALRWVGFDNFRTMAEDERFCSRSKIRWSCYFSSR